MLLSSSVTRIDSRLILLMVDLRVMAGRLRLGTLQCEAETTSLAFLTSHGHGSAVRFNYFFCDCQAQARARWLAARHSEKSLKYPSQMLLRNTYSGVLHN